MNFGTAKSLVKRRLSRFVTNSSTFDDYLLDEFNAAIDELEEGPYYPYFLEQEASVNISAGTRYATLPTGFLEQTDVPPVVEVSGELIPLTKMPRALLDVDPRFGETVGSEQGQPRYYAMDANRIYLGPTPDINYTVYLYGYFADEDIALDADETLWLKYAASVVMAKVGLIIASAYVENPRAVNYFSAEFARNYTRLLQRNAARESSAIDGGLVE